MAEPVTTATGISAAAIGSAMLQAYPVIESIVRTHNARKAAELRHDLDTILGQFNLRLDQLRKQLELKGINYNQLMEKLNFVSPGGGGDQARRKAEKLYRQEVDTINSAIADTNKKMNEYSAMQNEDISKLENRGILKTILSGIGVK